MPLVFSTSSVCLLGVYNLSYYLPIAGGGIIGFIPFPRVLVLCEMQSVSSMIWTRIVVFNSYDDSHYTMGTDCISSVPVLGFPILLNLRPCTLDGQSLLTIYEVWIWQCISYVCYSVALSLLQIIIVIEYLSERFLSGFSPQLNFFLLLSISFSGISCFLR